MNKPLLLLLALLFTTGIALAQLQNVALNRPVIVSSELRAPQNIGAFAVDGINNPLNDASRWVSATGYPHSIEVILDKAYFVSQVAFSTGHSGYRYPAVDYQVQYWNGTQWITVIARAGNSNAQVSESFQAISTDRIRLYATKGTDGYLRLFEFEVFAETYDPDPDKLWRASGTTIHADSGALVGINTASPQFTLDVAGQANSHEVLTNGEVRIDQEGNATFSSLQASGLQYPTEDGEVGQVLTTNGDSVLSFQNMPAAGNGLLNVDGFLDIGGTLTKDLILDRAKKTVHIFTGDSGSRFKPRIIMQEIGSSSPLLLQVIDSHAQVGRSAFLRLTDGAVESGVTGDGMQARLVAADRDLGNTAAVMVRSGTELNAGGEVWIGDPFGGWNFRGMYYENNTISRNAGFGVNPRWIPDKEYADTYLAGYPMTESARAPGTPQDGYTLFWNNTLKKYDLKEINASAIVSVADSTSRSFAVNTSSQGVSIVKSVNGTDSSYLVVDSRGFVGIGTSSPDKALTVKGQIHAEEVTIDLAVPAPDYVFEETYPLPELNDVETFIKENKHLPYMAPAREVDAEGLKLAESQMNLLRTVEELVLYQIQMQKQLQELVEKNEKLQEEVNLLKATKE